MTTTQKTTTAAGALIATAAALAFLLNPGKNTITVNNSAELYEAFRIAESEPLTQITIEAPVLYLDSGLRVSGVLNSRGKRLKVSGNGCSVVCNSDTIRAAFFRQPANQTEALNSFQSSAITFEDINVIMKGSRTIGFDLAAMYGGGTRNCSTTGGRTGFRFAFCLNSFAEQCYTTHAAFIGFVDTIGNWTGAGKSNSQSNHFKYNQCRAFNGAGSFAAFGSFGNSGVIREQCISEGREVRFHFLRNSLGSNWVKDGADRFLHVESATTAGGASVGLFLAGGYYTLEGLWDQMEGTKVYAEGTAYPHLHISGVPWLPGSRSRFAFKAGTTNVVWHLSDVIKNPNDTALWVGGRLPLYRYFEHYQQNPTLYSGGLKINDRAPVLQ